MNYIVYSFEAFCINIISIDYLLFLKIPYIVLYIDLETLIL